jgi:hypothetical protein
MFNRFHNYVSEQLAVINENGRFNKPSKKSPDTAWKKYDNDLFQTARLITCGLYINVILLDYLRTTVGLNLVNSTWYDSSPFHSSHTFPFANGFQDS